MSSKILLSPSEFKLKQLMKNDAITSDLCEEKGADILIYSSNGLLGIQRKALPNDFTSSMTDGRFAKSLPLITEHCVFSRVVCEGKFKYWPDGTLMIGMTKDRKRIPTRFNRQSIHGMLNDIEFIYGIQIRYTEDIEDTVRYIKSLQRYLDAKKHVGLFSRPKAQSTWSVPTRKDIHLWILQSFGGIGVTTADKIVSHYGRAPLQWTCAAKDLANVANVQIKRAEEWIDCLECNVNTTHDIVNSIEDTKSERSLNQLRRMLLENR